MKEGTINKGYTIYPSLNHEFEQYCKQKRLTHSEGIRIAIKELLRAYMLEKNEVLQANEPAQNNNNPKDASIL